MNFTKIILSIVMQILPTLISQISPVLREMIKTFILELEKKAKESQNPFDDMFVALLKAVFDIEE